MTRKRKRATTNAEAPITGVATGSLGTAANLDDTQVMRTADLQAAATGWLDDDGLAAPAGPAAPVEFVAPVEPVAPVETPASQAAAVAPPRERARRSPAVAVEASTRSRRSMPALAGVAALVLLLLIAGSGFLSQLDLGSGTGPVPASSGNALSEAAPTPTAQPKGDKGGNGKCHGRGHNCQGNED